ncbi:WAT1-related protein At5g64700 isoform X3 [Elaeis guineensis]|uniref:WAT1-related protein n=1 Tax=Elaeis guineensis var. tenera TaxID=51953 RepID=A0A6I9RRH3_ELAGV|nr:WAT1-related protein At5g64700 isoform X3 [Elaeis guineensis]
MEDMKVYVVIFLISFIYAVMQILTKAAFDGGMSTFIYVFYRQLIGTLFVSPVALVLERNIAPPLSFKVCFKIFLLTLVGIETIKIKKLQGIAKVSGIVLCLAGILTLAFFKGPQLKSFNHHHLFGHRASQTDRGHSKWALGILLMTISTTALSLGTVLQGFVLKEYPAKLAFTALQCLCGAIQSFFVALAFERDFSRWKLGFNMNLLSVTYGGIMATGVTFYLQSWTIEKKGPVFLAMGSPLILIIQIICSYVLLGEIINLGSILSGVLMVGGLYGVLWGKKREENDRKKQIRENEKACLEEKETAIPAQGVLV